MTITPDHQKALDYFFEGAIPLENSGLGVMLSFVAIEHQNEFVLVAGKLFKNMDLWAQAKPSFVSPKVQVRSYHLNELYPSLDQLLEAIFGGILHTPAGAFKFPPQNANHAVFPYELRQFPDGRIVNGLQISGIQRNDIEKYPSLDWAIKNAGDKTRNFREFLSERGYEPSQGAIQIDLIDLPVATLDAASRFDGQTAEIIINLPKGFETDEVSLQVRAFEDQSCLNAETLDRGNITWAIVDGGNFGRAHVLDRACERLECVLFYRGRPQHEIRLIPPPRRAQNPLDAIDRFSDDRTVDELVSSIHRDIDRGKPEVTLDRLHTYCMKKFAYLLALSGESVTDNEPLNSRVGRVFNPLRRRNVVSPMSAAIMKGTTEAFEAFNKIRNESSLAHDNELLSSAEAYFIFDGVQNMLQFVKWIESEHINV